MNTAAPGAPAKPFSSANDVTWNLQDLYAAVDDPRIEQDLDAALQRAQAFEKAYRGKIEVASGPQPGLLRSALDELESERPVETHATLGGIHGFRNTETERPEMTAEGERRFPIEHRRCDVGGAGGIEHDVRGGVGNAAGEAAALRCRQRFS